MTFSFSLRVSNYGLSLFVEVFPIIYLTPLFPVVYLIYVGLKVLSDEYSNKQKEGKSTATVMFRLAWDIKDMSDLIESGRTLKVTCQVLVEKSSLDESDWIGQNIPRKLNNVRCTLKTFICGLFKYKRTAATHILVVMISTEERNRKPYALPVQCMPYVGLKDNQVREIFDDIIRYMTNKGMKVAGTYTHPVLFYGLSLMTYMYILFRGKYQWRVEYPPFKGKNKTPLYPPD